MNIYLSAKNVDFQGRIFSQLFVLKTDPAGPGGQALKIRAEILLQVIVLVHI